MHAPAQPTIPPEMLLLAYRSGIFPMADGREDPEIFYVEPRRRAILPLDGFRCSRSLALAGDGARGSSAATAEVDIASAAERATSRSNMLIPFVDSPEICPLA